jgi:hypothetical protein
MAKTVATFPEVKRGRPIKYPYQNWFNGKKWALAQGKDFDVDASSFKAALYAAKNRMGYVIVTTETVENGVPVVYVQRLMGAVAKNHLAKRKAKAAA